MRSIAPSPALVVRRDRPGDRLARRVHRRVLGGDEALEDLLDVCGQRGGHRREYIGVDDEGKSDVRVVLTDAAAEVVGAGARRAAGRPVARDRQRLLRLDGAVPVRGLPAGPERARGRRSSRVCRILLDDAIARSFEGREVVVDAGGDPQPDSFSCESRARLPLLPGPPAGGLDVGSSSPGRPGSRTRGSAPLVSMRGRIGYRRAAPTAASASSGELKLRQRLELLDRREHEQQLSRPVPLERLRGREPAHLDDLLAVGLRRRSAPAPARGRSACRSGP